MDIRKIKRKIKRKIRSTIESIILILLLTVICLGIFCWTALIVNFFVPVL